MTRAQKWWQSLPFEIQFFKVIEWATKTGRTVGEAHPHKVTEADIEALHRIEINKQANS